MVSLSLAQVARSFVNPDGERARLARPCPAPSPGNFRVPHQIHLSVKAVDEMLFGEGAENHTRLAHPPSSASPLRRLGGRVRSPDQLRRYGLEGF